MTSYTSADDRLMTDADRAGFESDLTSALAELADESTTRDRAWLLVGRFAALLRQLSLMARGRLESWTA